MVLPLNQIICGDCVEVMKDFPENSIDLAATDPPYGIAFMGKEWDKALPPKEAFVEMFRVLKPGALAFVMSSPRQDVMWRMARILEESGFELGQSFISWVYASGFPKAYDISKGIDAKKGLKQKVVGRYKDPNGREYYPTKNGTNPNPMSWEIKGEDRYTISEPASAEAKKWSGWKSITGLKPALEVILMVNKPFSEKTIVDNVLKWGTGAINVEACRIPIERGDDSAHYGGLHETPAGYSGGFSEGFRTQPSKGRFPANLLVSDNALNDGKITVSKGGERKNKTPNMGRNEIYGKSGVVSGFGFEDSGSFSRYFDLDAWAKHHGFLRVPKAGMGEREYGLYSGEFGPPPASKRSVPAEGRKSPLGKSRRNIHPTVKPVELMAYLIELGCPPDGVVIDPFLGSGTTCIAAKRLNRKYIGIEIDPEYHKISMNRVSAYPEPLDWITERVDLQGENVK